MPHCPFPAATHNTTNPYNGRGFILARPVLPNRTICTGKRINSVLLSGRERTDRTCPERGDVEPSGRLKTWIIHRISFGSSRDRFCRILFGAGCRGRILLWVGLLWRLILWRGNPSAGESCCSLDRRNADLKRWNGRRCR